MWPELKIERPNLPFGEIQRDGRMLPARELRARFAELLGQRERLAVSCGSGVTACVLALGAEPVGCSEVSVYDGSWSDWGHAVRTPGRGRRVNSTRSVAADE